MSQSNPTIVLPDPDDLAPLEVLPGVLVEIVPDPDKRGAERLEGVEWPALVTCPPAAGDAVYSLDGATVGLVTRRGHKIGPLGPYLVVFLVPAE